ncbi:MAG TPA: sensor domain-containing diguanylate cyclase [Armatimonadota bacterium]
MSALGPENLRGTAPAKLSLVSLGFLPVLVAAIAHLAGGLNSPWLGLMYVPLVAAGFRSVAVALTMAGWTMVLYLALWAVHPESAQYGVSGHLVHLATFVAVALVPRTLIERADARRTDVADDAAAARTALDVQQMMSAAYDLNMTLDLVILKQRELLKTDACAILLTEGSSLRVRVASGIEGDGRSVRISIHDDDHGWTPKDGRPQVVADTSITATRYSEIDPPAKSILLVPLLGVERLVGLLYFGSHRPDAFTSHAVDRAEEFSNSVVFPVQRALLEEDLRRLAFTDAQTSLFNHRHFQDQLDEEVSRAQRYGRAVSLILMDIDDFKVFNDTFGHPAGDRLLADLAHTLKADLRTVDIAARYGGEEFVVICPETQRDQAMILAERLCATIADERFHVDGGESQPVTVSIGVASYPQDARNKTELVDAADHALYEAKRRGKNCVVPFSAS